jgi:hypothetical protein
MLRELFNLALVPLFLTDMMIVNLIITSVYVLVAFKIAHSIFKPEGLIRSILHWIIKIAAYLLLCEATKIVLLFI